MVMRRQTITIMLIIMSDISTHLTLQTWISAAFPTGAFTCSHGLETAIADERINNADTCLQWISTIMQYGSGWNDAILMANTCALIAAVHPEAFQNDSQPRTHDRHCTSEMTALKTSLNEINDLALALCAGAERLRETTQLGAAFVKAATPWFAGKSSIPLQWIDADISLPIATGICGSLAGIPAVQLLPASLQASSSNLVWIATRPVPLGQTQALEIIAALAPIIESTALLALHSPLDDISSGALLADLCSIEHEQLQTRICIT